MQSTRRTAMPLRVHQIWDAIGRFSSSQVMDFEKLVEVVTSMHKVPRDELNHELEYAVKDGLVVREVVETQRREETEIYRLPDYESLDRGDHDWYCFHCHLGGPVVKCEDCPRVFHLECLPEDRKPDKDLFVCPPCHIISTKPSAERIGLKSKQLNQLIEYICNRFSTWSAEWLEASDGAIWAKACDRSDKEAWRYNILVYMPIDLTIMSKKATAAKYQSLEEFQVDCETLVHSIGVYFGLDHLKGNHLGAAFIREAMHDIQEIKLCHQCFRRSNEKDHDWWFCLPCTPPHDVVWAKQTGYPYWAAKVMKREGNKYDVRYFGGNYERGIIDAKNIQPIETNINQLRVRRNAAWNDAYDELQKFQEIAKNPSFVNSLPVRGKSGTPGKKAGKRASNTVPEEAAAPKKSRKSEPTPAPAKTPSKKSSASGKASSKDTPPPKTNGTTSPQAASSTKKKHATTPKSASNTSTPSRRDSGVGKDSSSGSSVKGKKSSMATGSKDISHLSDLDETLDPEVRSLLQDTEDDDSLGGSVYFSDDESSELNDKVSEDAVSSSCNESKSTRNAYVQVSKPGTKEVNVEKLSTFIAELKERHKAEVDLNKKKQWCFNCGREAIYHCCWNTAYCSIECQQQHWTTEHKRLCRRVRRDRGGTGVQGDDY